MSGRLTVTSGELRATAGEMKGTASNIANEFNRMMGKVRELTGTWTGQGASAFNGYYEQFNQSWSKCQEALNGVSQLLERAATAYDDAETAISKQFQG
ncbi:MAG: WXG100 family type VII secretion target [Actinobacteria bacterium]|nr:WXG100 family type VII secretion target [Actinomycetota bacterium]